MFRLIFSLLFWVTLARWGYQEIALYSPEVTPFIDRFIERFTPPTHDKWPQIVVKNGIDGFSIQLLPATEQRPK